MRHRSQIAFQSYQSPRSILLLVACAYLASTVQNCCACPLPVVQDSVESAKDVFSQRNYPWYDEASDGVYPVDLAPRQDAASRDRDSVRKGTDRNATGGGGGGTGGAVGSGFSVIVWIALAILIALLCGLLLRAFFRIESKKQTYDIVARRSRAESIKHLPFQMEERTGDFRQLAEQAYRAGDFRRAITYLFSHTLVTLDQQGIIRLKKGKTNRQYLGELRSYVPLAQFYERVMIPFESTFFGDHDLSKVEFESCWNDLDGFQNRVTESSQVAS